MIGRIVLEYAIDCVFVMAAAYAVQSIYYDFKTLYRGFDDEDA